jgi:hypothetical protein
MSRSVSFCSRLAIGNLMITRGAAANLTPDDLIESLTRHLSGDWGDLDQQDRRTNDQALAHGGRIFSVYRGENGTRFYVITEADRTVTTILLPSEY